MAVDNQHVLKGAQKSFYETTNQMRKEAGNSAMGQYFSGLKDEVKTLKTQMKGETGASNSKDVRK